MSTAEPINEAHLISMESLPEDVLPWHSSEASDGPWTTLVTMGTNQYHIPIFAFDGEGTVAPFSFANLPGGMVWGLVTLG
jgi:hypothetical protein